MAFTHPKMCYNFQKGCCYSYITQVHNDDGSYFKYLLCVVYVSKGITIYYGICGTPDILCSIWLCLKWTTSNIKKFHRNQLIVYDPMQGSLKLNWFMHAQHLHITNWTVNILYTHLVAKVTTYLTQYR